MSFWLEYTWHSPNIRSHIGLDFLIRFTPSTYASRFVRVTSSVSLLVRLFHLRAQVEVVSVSAVSHWFLVQTSEA